MSMQLTIVGCSGSYPGPDSPASYYLVQAEHEGRTWNILMDLGNGALGALHRYVDPLDIDAVFLSHLHADHCIDMTSYYVLRKYHPSGEQEPLPVWGPRRTARRLARAYDLPKKPGMREEFVFHRLRPEEDPVEVGPFSVTPYAVDHPVEAYAFRVQVGDRVLAYSGDTGPFEIVPGASCGDWHHYAFIAGPVSSGECAAACAKDAKCLSFERLMDPPTW